ncbi:hypothetical protein WJ438_16395 [Streptomyces sp. GD-15H]|uniref:hypothetical protein n=1 Tax=Streptomyces sp. GD-15H TaxID=3129112 RepID=UPI0032461F73
MTWSAVLSGAAPRAMRTAAGRRALHLTFLVGAVFALGVLCGERAQAADGGGPVNTSSASPAAGAVAPVAVADGVGAGLTAAAGRTGEPDPPATGAHSGEGVPAPAQSAAHGPGPAHSAQPRPEHADADEDTDEGTGNGKHPVRSVGERGVTPVADRLGGVAAGLTEATEKVLPAPSPPSLPQAPAPSLPTVPGLAAPGLAQPAPLPGFPGLSDVPVEPGLPRLPAVLPDILPAPLIPDPPTGAAALPPPADASAPTARPEAAEAATHGPDVGGAGTGLAVDPLAHDDAEHRATPPAPHTDPTPAPHAPGGSPDGTTGNRSAADHGTPRHGDAHAVTPSHRLRVRLVPGAAAPIEAAETRDRERDVPVPPAWAASSG